MAALLPGANWKQKGPQSRHKRKLSGAVAGREEAAPTKVRGNWVMFEHNYILCAAEGSGQDRIKILDYGERIVVAAADGAGGRSGGAEAADMALELMIRQATCLTSQSDCERLLGAVDVAIASDKVAGETTGIIAVLSANAIIGASVGDSGAWILDGAGIDDLTRHQVRKPFLGTNGACPAGFTRSALRGTLLVATDGLLKYTSRELIAGVVQNTAIAELPAALVKLVRYPSGALPDDVTIGLCRSK